MKIAKMARVAADISKKIMQKRIAPDTLRPTTCSLVLTGECNLRCQTCSYHTRRFAELTKTQWISIIDDLHNNRFNYAGFLGGEVFLRKDWYEIVSYAKKMGFINVLVTNGTLIDKHMDKLGVFDYLRFSIDSLKMHDKIRGVDGTFKKVVYNLQLVLDAGYKVDMATVLQKDNYEEIPDLVNFAEDIGIKSLNLIYPSLDLFDNTAASNPSIREFDFERLKVLLKDACRHKIVSNSYDSYEMFIKSTLNGARKSCIAPRVRIVVQPSGNVFPCCGNLPSVGNIAKNKFEDIWKSEKYRLIREKTFNGNMNKCFKCVSGHYYDMYSIKRICKLALKYLN